MACAKIVIFALGALGEPGQPVFLAQCADAVAAAGQDLVRIALVPDIKDHPVMRCVEDLVDGDRQLDDAEARTQMPAGPRDCIDHLRAQFCCQLRQILVVDPLQIIGIGYLIEKRGRRHWMDWQLCHARAFVLAPSREPRCLVLVSAGSRVFKQNRYGLQNPVFLRHIGQFNQYYRSGKGINSSSSPGTMSKRPVRHSSLA